jgi:hypothetical protein
VWAVLAIALAVAGTVHAQGRGGAAQGRGGGAPPTARSQAPKDFTGSWVAVVTEHWASAADGNAAEGEFAMLPLNMNARNAANMWTPAQDAGGNECRAYGAASIMRIPGRLNIHWADDNTLQIDTDFRHPDTYAALRRHAACRFPADMCRATRLRNGPG